MSETAATLYVLVPSMSRSNVWESEVYSTVVLPQPAFRFEAWWPTEFLGDDPVKLDEPTAQAIEDCLVYGTGILEPDNVVPNEELLRSVKRKRMRRIEYERYFPDIR